MQQLVFIDKPITQHISGTIVPIFRSEILYTTAYGVEVVFRLDKQPLHSAHDLPPGVPRLLPAL